MFKNQTQWLLKKDDNWSTSMPLQNLKSKILDQYLKHLGFYGNFYLLLCFTTTDSGCKNL